MSSSQIFETISKNYSGKKILITGAGGYLGSTLSKTLSAVDCDLFLQIHQNQPDLPSPKARIEFIRSDLNDENFWEPLLRKSVDTIFHLAENNYLNKEPLSQLKGSALPILRLMELCQKNKLSPKIIFTSSSNLVGKPDKLPVNEDFPDHPMNMYGIHKLLTEHYFQYYGNEYGLSTITLRLANVYGPSNEKKTFLRPVVNKMISHAIQDNTLTLFSNQNCVRDYIYIDDVITALLSAGRPDIKPKRPYYLIGSETPVTINELALLIAKILARKGIKSPEIAVDTDKVLSAIETRNFVSDCGNFKSLTKWRAQTKLEEGLEKTVDYFLELNKKT